MDTNILLRCALADLEGLAPHEDMSHPAWTTIRELRQAIDKLNVVLITPVLLEVSGNCAFESCDSLAEIIACGQEDGHDSPACYCKKHADEIARECCTEYKAGCPNCGCWFGVG